MNSELNRDGTNKSSAVTLILGLLVSMLLVLAPAMAVTYTLTVQTDQASYTDANPIHITGTVTPAPGPNTAVFLVLLNPNGKPVDFGSEAVDPNTGAWSHTTIAGGMNLWITGTFTVNATWGAPTGAILNQKTTFSYTVATTTTTTTTSTTTQTTTVTTTSTAALLPITVKSVDLNANPLPGLATTIKSNNVTVDNGYTPLTFNGTSGATYTICVTDYQNDVFSHWFNGSTDRCITILLTQPIVLTAYYNTQPIITTTSETSTSSTIPEFNPQALIIVTLLVLAVVAVIGRGRLIKSPAALTP